MVTNYTDVDRLILERWDEVSELIAAREELEAKIGDVVEAAGERLRRWLEPQGYALDVHVRDAQFDVYRRAWEHKRRGTPVYFALGAFCPEGYRRCEDAHPYLRLYTDTLENFKLKPEQRRAFGADLRSALGQTAREWTDDECDDEDAPIGRYLRDVDSRSRCELVSSPDKLYAFACAELPTILSLADTVESCVTRLLGRQP